MASVTEKENSVDNDAENAVGGLSRESEKEILEVDDTFSKSSEVAVEGKRQRTAVKAFTSAAPPKEKKGLEFEVGHGTLLGDIEIVTEYMGKTHSDSYVSLHRLLYNSQGVALQRKGNIRKFNGFNFDKDSKLYSNKLASIKKMKSVDRKLTLKLLGLNQTSSIQDLMDFLMCPEDKGKHAPGKKKSKTPAKRRRSTTKDSEKKESPAKKKSSAKTKPKQKSTPKRKKTVSKQDTDDEVEDSDSLSASDSEPVSDNNDKETDQNPTKKRKVSDSVLDISKDDSFSGPSDEDLIDSIKKVVDEIDLEEVSMKEALKKVYESYPGVDLTDRKSFIKDNIRKLVG